MNRQQAEQNYKKAVAAQRAAEDISESAYLAAVEICNKARITLVETEIACPTPKEIRRQNEILRLRNRGLDV